MEKICTILQKKNFLALMCLLVLISVKLWLVIARRLNLNISLHKIKAAGECNSALIIIIYAPTFLHVNWYGNKSESYLGIRNMDSSVSIVIRLLNELIN